MNMNDDSFSGSSLYQSFLAENSGKGNLKIRAFAASEALPIEGLRIIVSTIYHDEKIIFFDGVTDSSGMIEKLSLPTPKMSLNNMDVPSSTIYEIEAIDLPDNVDQFFQVKMYDGICVIQNIGIVPNSGDGSYGR